MIGDVAADGQNTAFLVTVMDQIGFKIASRLTHPGARPR